MLTTPALVLGMVTLAPNYPNLVKAFCTWHFGLDPYHKTHKACQNPPEENMLVPGV